MLNLVDVPPLSVLVYKIGNNEIVIVLMIGTNKGIVVRTVHSSQLTEVS